MFNVVLYQPEIPPNTGNIIRLCANTGALLHLVGPLGFEIDEARVRRAGLDYHDMTSVSRYINWEDFLQRQAGLRLWAFSSRGSEPYHRARFERGDGLLFGPESRGLPDSVLAGLGRERVVRLPMKALSRSLNLSNTVAIALYEALRQNRFAGLA